LVHHIIYQNTRRLAILFLVVQISSSENVHDLVVTIDSYISMTTLMIAYFKDTQIRVSSITPTTSWRRQLLHHWNFKHRIKTQIKHPLLLYWFTSTQSLPTPPLYKLINWVWHIIWNIYLHLRSKASFCCLAMISMQTITACCNGWTVRWSHDSARTTPVAGSTIIHPIDNCSQEQETSIYYTTRHICLLLEQINSRTYISIYRSTVLR